MNWSTSLQDQLPFMLVLSPIIGFIATWAVSRIEKKLIWPIALANLICTAAILGLAEWQFESDIAAAAESLEAAYQEAAGAVGRSEFLISAGRAQDRLRAERLNHQWFALDGINLFPSLLAVLIVFITVWEQRDAERTDGRAIPLRLLFLAAALGSMSAYDLRVFLFMNTACAILMSVFIYQGNYPSRRDHAERFLFEQFCANALIMLGFSVLIIAAPWMKIPDSVEIPNISWNIASLVQDIQKWSARNELAYHYAGEVFPWMLMLLSVGFAIQSGLFPFHTTQVRLFSHASPRVVLLYLAGSLLVGRIGWLRFVLPLAPDLLATFDRWLLIPSLGGAIWGVVAAFATSSCRERTAWVFMSLSAVGLFGSYCFTRFGVLGTWLLHLQLAVDAVLGLMMALMEQQRTGTSQSDGMQRGSQAFSSRTVFLWLCVSLVGLFSSLYLIVADLVFDSLYMVGGLMLLSVLIGAAVLGLLNDRFRKEQQVSVSNGPRPDRLPLYFVGLVTLGVSFFPSLLVHQCDPELARVFRRFEQSATANSAETDSIESDPSE